MRKERIIPRRNNDPLNENIPVDHLLQYEDINKPHTFGFKSRTGYLIRIPLLKYDEMHTIKGIEDWRYPVLSNYYYTDEFIELPYGLNLNYSHDIDYEWMVKNVANIYESEKETYLYKVWINYDCVTIVRSEDTSLMVAVHDCFVKLNWCMGLFDKNFKEK